MINWPIILNVAIKYLNREKTHCICLYRGAIGANSVAKIKISRVAHGISTAKLITFNAQRFCIEELSFLAHECTLNEAKTLKNFQIKDKILCERKCFLRLVEVNLHLWVKLLGVFVLLPSKFIYYCFFGRHFMKGKQCFVAVVVVSGFVAFIWFDYDRNWAKFDYKFQFVFLLWTLIRIFFVEIVRCHAMKMANYCFIWLYFLVVKFE